MKRLLIVIQIVSIFIFCSCNTEAEVIENVSLSSVTQNTIINEHTNEIETSSAIDKSKTKLGIDIILDALIEKDENELWRIGYIEGNDGFLYNVDFESYKILNSLNLQRTDMTTEFVYTVELNISQSTDSRFPEGISIWNIGMLESEFCEFFLPQAVDVNVVDAYWDNKRAQIGRYYTFSFNENNDIQDTQKLNDVVGNYIFEEGVKSFLIGMKPELGNGGDVLVEKHVVDDLLNQYFGISDYGVCDENVIIKCDSYRWQSETVYALVNDQRDTYIDVTYYADFAYLTPAYKIRYYFTNDNNPINLTAVELVEDYGYKPLTQMF